MDVFTVDGLTWSWVEKNFIYNWNELNLPCKITNYTTLNLEFFILSDLESFQYYSGMDNEDRDEMGLETYGMKLIELTRVMLDMSRY